MPVAKINQSPTATKFTVIEVNDFVAKLDSMKKLIASANKAVLTPALIAEFKEAISAFMLKFSTSSESQQKQLAPVKGRAEAVAVVLGENSKNLANKNNRIQYPSYLVFDSTPLPLYNSDGIIVGYEAVRTITKIYFDTPNEAVNSFVNICCSQQDTQGRPTILANLNGATDFPPQIKLSVAPNSTFNDLVTLVNTIDKLSVSVPLTWDMIFFIKNEPCFDIEVEDYNLLKTKVSWVALWL